jgi:cyclohexadienyl dehydratase
VTGARRPRRPSVFVAALLSVALAGAGRTFAAHASAGGPSRSLDGDRFLGESASVDRVLRLEDERLALMPAVAAWKRRHHLAVRAPARERAVIHAAVTLGAPLGLAAPSLERLFELQVRLASAYELALQRRWRTRGYDFRGRIPDLRGELRPRLDRLTRQLLRAIYLAAPALARASFATLYSASAARLLHSAGWSAASRRELLDALAALRLSATPALERIRASRILRVATTGDYAPFSADVGGRLTGADIELARALARTLGVRPVFVRTSWPTLLADLRRDQFDVAIGGISATAARAAAGALSIPYLSSGKTLIARCRDASRYASLADVDRPGVRVIVNPGGTNERYVRSHIHRARIIVDASNGGVFEQLIAGRADVMITDDVEVRWQTHRHPQLCRTLPGTLTHAEKVILMPRDPALEAAVDGWLRAELAAGMPARWLDEALSR